MQPLLSRYHEVLQYRIEGLKKYGGLLTSDFFGPPARLSLPTLSLREPITPFVRVGPLFVADHPPVLDLLYRLLETMPAPTKILEVGPARGTVAKALQTRFPDKVVGYAAIERDETVSGPYRRISDIAHVDFDIDLFIACEVMEHMSLEDFFENLLPAAVERMTASSVAVLTTPNAMSPTSIFNDFTHVKGYNFFDLYGLLRLFFKEVDVYRTRYVWSLERLLTLLPRMALCRLLEMDWCEGLICIARSPRNEN